MSKIFPINPAMIGVSKMVKHRSKMLQHLLQNFQRSFDRFLDTRCYRVNIGVTAFLEFSPELQK